MEKPEKEEQRRARRKIPREGPPLYFSHPLLRSEGTREDSVNLHFETKRIKLLAGVSIGPSPGSGFIHMFPTKEQIDEIVAGLLDLKSRL